MSDVMTLSEVKKQYGFAFEINKAKELYEQMVNEEQKYTKLKELTFTDYVCTVKNNIDYFEYLCLIPSAEEYLAAVKNNRDKRTKEFKENKATFELLQKRMCEWFNHSITIIDFCSGGYEGYYREIQFTADGGNRKFSFTIPNPKLITEKNFPYVSEGKLSFGEYLPDNFTHEIKISSYFFEEIQKAFEEEMNVQSN